MSEGQQTIHCHLESTRIGVRLALWQIQGRMPPEDYVTRVLQTVPPNITLVAHDYPLNIVQKLGQERSHRRRDYAMESLRSLLLRCNDPQLMTDRDLEKVSSQAWNLARFMMSEEQVAEQLDSIPAKVVP